MIKFQRLESFFVLLSLVFIYFYALHYSWLTLLIFLFFPDIFMFGYLFNPKIGAYIYNLAHNLIITSLVLIAALVFQQSFLLQLTLIWLIHIFMDRSFGFGLKYYDDFKHTHLSTT